MKTRSLFILVVTALALLLAGAALLPHRTAQAISAVVLAPSQPETIQVTEVITCTSIIISNESPGYLIDYLIDTGHGEETLFEVLTYLKPLSYGVISDAFYDQVAAEENYGKEVYTAILGNYAGLEGGIEISNDATVNIPNVQADDYVGTVGYPTINSSGDQFLITYAQDEAHHIYTHSGNYGPITKIYYAFAIAWRGETVSTFVISNEAPGYLVDRLIAAGHGNDTLLEVLAYLKPLSNGVITDAFYDQAAAAPPGSELFTATLSNYAGLVGGIEIAADGTISIPSIQGSSYLGAAWYATQTSTDGQFLITYAHDAPHNIYTHTTNFGGGVIRDYYAFAIAWDRGNILYLPLVVKK